MPVPLHPAYYNILIFHIIFVFLFSYIYISLVFSIFNVFFWFLYFFSWLFAFDMHQMKKWLDQRSSRHLPLRQQPKQRQQLVPRIRLCKLFLHLSQSLSLSLPWFTYDLFILCNCSNFWNVGGTTSFLIRVFLVLSDYYELKTDKYGTLKTGIPKLSESPWFRKWRTYASYLKVPFTLQSDSRPQHIANKVTLKELNSHTKIMDFLDYSLH